MKVFKNIGLGLLAVILLGACANPLIKDPDKDCGPYPGPDEVSGNIIIASLMGQRSSLYETLATQPLEYVQCRAHAGDQGASYVLGLFYLNGIRVEKDVKLATANFVDATYKPAGRGTSIVSHNGSYAGIVNFETTPERPGVWDAYYQLGKMHEQGLIQGVNLETAEWLFNVAASKGHVKAAEALSALKARQGEEN